MHTPLVTGRCRTWEVAQYEALRSAALSMHDCVAQCACSTRTGQRPMGLPRCDPMVPRARVPWPFTPTANRLPHKSSRGSQPEETRMRRFTIAARVLAAALGLALTLAAGGAG